MHWSVTLEMTGPITMSNFIDQVVAAVPSLEGAASDHRRENDGEDLPYVFLTEACYLVVGAHSQTPATVGGDAERLFRFLDFALANGDENVRTMIGVEVAEAILDAPDRWTPVRSFVGPCLAEEIRRTEAWWRDHRGGA
jgi:hypothetical protein